MSADSEYPIFVVGSGRSGSTIFYEMLTKHPDVAWMTPMLRRLPQYPQLNRLMLNLFRLPAVGSGLQRSRLGQTTEGYPYWDRYWRGFAAPDRDLTAEDVTPVNRRAVLKVLESIPTPQRRRPIIKLTGWPRIGFLRAICPQAKFVHIVRDGRSVANSYLNINWWTGWKGPNNWAWGELSPDQRRIWEESGRSFVALAALNWTILMEAFEKATASLDDTNFMLIHYHQFCAEPVDTFRRLTAFCDLRWTSEFENSIRATTLNSADDKWKRDLTPDQQRLLERITQPYLERYGYQLLDELSRQ